MSVLRWIAQTHALFALGLLLVVTVVMASQVARRQSFADTELHEDVMDSAGEMTSAPAVMPTNPARMPFNNIDRSGFLLKKE